MASYKFRVLLDNTENEEIFRDIELDGFHTFEQFYNIIIKAFEFNGDQMASFYASNTDWDKGEEIGLFEMGEENGTLFHLMSNSLIEDFINSESQRFILVYDFLKMWCFLIELIQTNANSLNEPEITLSIGATLPEESREIDFEMPGNDLGNDFDDIFSESEDYNLENEDDFGGFENIDDYDF